MSQTGNTRDTGAHAETPASDSAQTRTALRAYSVGPPPPAGTRRLHLNEYRYPHPPGVVEALREALTGTSVDTLLTNYQSGPDAALVDDLAQYVGAASGQNILVASGSDEVLRAVLDTSGLRGHRALLMGIPGYTHFEHYARLKGLEIVAYPIGLATPAHEHLASLLYYADFLASGCLVYLCSPNNPTGDLWSAGDVAKLAGQYPHSLFLVDEAYVEFASCAGGDVDFPADADHAAALNAASLVSIALAHDNVVVTRTMSKAFGFAALRIGYAVGTAKTIQELGVAVSPKAFNPIASAVARAALQPLSLAHYRRTTAAARREARLVVESLRGQGWWTLDTPGNFYLVYVADAAGATARLAKEGVQVRNRDDLPGLSGFIRLTAGTAEDSRAVLSAFAQLTPPAAPPPQTLYTSKGVVAAIKTLLKRTLAVLAAARVEVWAQGGTLLGMFRHRSDAIPGGMIPWDDDADLGYLIRMGHDPLAGLIETFRAAGLTLQRNRTNAYWQVGTNAPGEVISPIHIDVFSFRASEAGIDGKPVYIVDDVRFREEEPDSPQAHCNTKFGHAELFPLSTDYRFYDLVVPAPAQTEKVLRRALGEGFMAQAKARTATGGLETFTLRDRTPA